MKKSFISKISLVAMLLLFLPFVISCSPKTSGVQKEILCLNLDNYLQLEKGPHLEIAGRFHPGSKILVESDYPLHLRREYPEMSSGIDLSEFEGRIVRILFSEAPNAVFLEQYKSSEQPQNFESFRNRHRHDNVLIIVFDAMNPTHLGCYGYSRKTSPVIDQFASKSIIWNQAFALAPYTLASTGALLTGLHPIMHRVLGEGNKLPEDFKTMAEYFHDSNYDTGMFLATPNATEHFGYTQGFRYVWQPARVINADEIASEFNTWLKKRRKRRFFAYVHIREPHDPYNPPAKFLGLFRNDPNFQLPKYDYGIPPSKEDQSKIRDAYDGSIAFADSELKKILDTLQELRMDDKTILILLADHGEAFWEHGIQGHNRTLYDEMLRIPLIMHIPREATLGNIRENQLVSNIDLFATFVDLFPFSRKGVLLSGQSLLPYILSQSEQDERWLSLQKYGRPYYAIRSSKFKYIQDLEHQKAELFLLPSDPLEKNNVTDKYPILSTFCKLELEKLRAQYRQSREVLQIEQPRSVITPEVREHLKALGYTY
jgi:arylsulfatase A-like enzyme